MLEPTRIYSLDCLELARTTDVHAFSHITGGGLAANIARVLPAHLAVDIDRATWRPQPVFDVIAQRVERSEMERTFNMGVGMMAFVAPESVDAALRLLAQRNVDSWVCGTVRDRRDGEMGDAEAKGGKGGAASVIGGYAR